MVNDSLDMHIIVILKNFTNPLILQKCSFQPIEGA